MKRAPQIGVREVDRSVAGSIMADRDVTSAVALGWLWMDADDAPSALVWFDRAKSWEPALPDARRGSAEANLRLAGSDYEAGRHAGALEHLNLASAQAPLPRSAMTLRGWSLLRSGDRPGACDVFAALYREQPDKESADGLIACTPEGSEKSLHALAQSGPLGPLVRAREASAAFASGRVLDAARFDPPRYADIGAIGAPMAAAAIGGARRSGEPGLGQLRTGAEPTVLVSAPVRPNLVLGARLDRLSLDAGTPQAGALIGSAVAPVPASGQFDRVHDTIETASLTARYENGYLVRASVGRSPIGGATAARTIGAAQLELTPAWGRFTIAAGVEPVRESVLAFAGMRDPFGETTWGGVVRRAAEARALWLQRAPWSATMRARIETLDGSGVADNRRELAEVGIGRDLQLPGFAYSSLGVIAGAERYRRNLSHFTLGQGGYFSPQMYRRAGVAFDFMTSEGKPWMARGRMSGGRESKREDAQAFFPLAPDGRIFPAVSGRGTDAAFQVAAAVRVNPYVQLSAAVSRDVSPQYRESQALLQVSISFSPRRAVVGADLPGRVGE